MRSLQAFQVVFFVVLSLDNCVGQGPQPLTCNTIAVDTSCQAKFGADPGDTPCSNTICDWDPGINSFICDPWDPTRETRTLPNWNGTYKGAGYAPEFELGVWGTLGMVQCVASRTCECQWDFNYDDIVCSLGGPETQQAEKFFLYAKYVTSEICSGTAQ